MLSSTLKQSQELIFWCWSWLAMFSS